MSNFKEMLKGLLTIVFVIASIFIGSFLLLYFGMVAEF